MDIVYSSSDAYAICTGVSLYSLYENNKDIDALNVHILSTDISGANKVRLHDIATKFGRTLDIIDAKEGFVEQAKKLNLPLLRGAYNTYGRVVLNTWFYHLDKVMIIDSDTLVCGYIKAAWDLDMTNYLVAAVPELAMYTKYNHFEDPRLLANVDTYYNMGICVINLKKWRDDNIDNMIYNRLTEDKPKLMIADQSIINMYLNKFITRLPLKFNFYSPVHNVSYSTVRSVFCEKELFSKEEFDDATNSPSIIHYFGHSYERPWFKHSVAIKKNKYLKTRELTSWHNVKLDKWRNSTSKILLCYDLICYILLLCHCYDACLKFRYNGGQIIKNILGINRIVK